MGCSEADRSRPLVVATSFGVTTADATRALGFKSEGFTYSLIRAGTLQATKDGGRWNVAEESVARYLDERQRRKRRRTRRQSEIASIIAASKERSVL
jgi:hypothetical protein